MGREGPGTFTPGSWTAPEYEVDADGKVVGYVNERQPNNWGRWGPLDERGTANFITPEIVRAAAGLIREGRVISCAVPLDDQGPLHPTRKGVSHWHSVSGADLIVGSPLNAAMPGLQATDDYITMPLQGSTQWDGLAHIAREDTLYNGFWLGNVEQVAGARRCSIHQLSRTLCGRGVLLDMARHHGVDRLQPGHAITSAELDACAEAQGVEVRTGDLLVLRTGHVPWWYELTDKMEFFASGAPGISMETVEWIHGKEIAAIAVDNVAVEVEPHEEPFEHVMPVHSRLIRDLGLTLGEVWHLEELADACAADGRYEFFLAAQPLNVTNASGTPINPVAIK
ncbi:MAG TPA: cyclase family protein [Baekduia sp.]